MICTDQQWPREGVQALSFELRLPPAGVQHPPAFAKGHQREGVQGRQREGVQALPFELRPPPAGVQHPPEFAKRRELEQPMGNVSTNDM